MIVNYFDVTFQFLSLIFKITVLKKAVTEFCGQKYSNNRNY